MKQQEKIGKIEIRYVDETGFYLIPYLPYASQDSKQKIEVKSQKSKRLNVLGFLTRQNELEVYTFLRLSLAFDNKVISYLPYPTKNLFILGITSP